MRNSTLYKLARPRTLRRSSTEIFEKWGSNLQNVKKDLREIYIPDGYEKEYEQRCVYFLNTGDLSVFTDEELDTLRLFIQRDQAGAEALIMAYLCRDGDYRKLFINGIKPHVYVAMKLFPNEWQLRLEAPDFNMEAMNKIAIPDLKKSPYWRPLDTLIKESDHWDIPIRYYYFAKQTCHSANYEVGEYMFRMNTLEKSGGKVVFTRDQAIYFLETYRGLFPEIPERNKEVAYQVERLGIIYNIFGFPCQVTGYNIPDNQMKEFYVWSPQSSVGEITRIAFSRLQEYIEDANESFDILADTHDSYLVQCRLNDLKKCDSKMKEYMNQRLISPVDGVEFFMKSETKIGFNWGEFSTTNKTGLREVNWL